MIIAAVVATFVLLAIGFFLGVSHAGQQFKQDLEDLRNRAVRAENRVESLLRGSQGAKPAAASTQPVSPRAPPAKV